MFPGRLGDGLLGLTRCAAGDPRTLSRAVLPVSILCLILTISGWTTCNAIFSFKGCEDAFPRINSISPSEISSDTDSVVLVVDGGNFSPQSQILWNGSPLPTTFVNSNTLQTTLTQQTLASLGGAAGSSVQISVATLSSVAAGCPNTVSSTTILILNIN